MKQKNEKGAMIVEASIVFPVMFLVIFFMIYAGNAFLQKCKVEAIISRHAIEAAAYCADPQLQEVSNSGVGGLSGNTQPYRFLTSAHGNSVATATEGKIKNELNNMGTGLFPGMKPEVTPPVVNFKNSFLYATLIVEVSYKVKIPIKLLGADDFYFLKVNSHIEIPVSDTTEMIRNVDMVWDYMERTGLDKPVTEFGDKLRTALNKANEWFAGG